MIEFLEKIDVSVLLAVNGWNSPFFDQLMWWASGKISWWPFYLAIIIYLFYKRKAKEAFIVLGLIILLITLSDQTSVHLFKNTFQRLRPSRNPDLEGMLHIVNDYRGGKFGFISSHASNTFAVACFMFPLFKRKWITAVLFSWAVFVSYSRIYLGVHYPGDVLAGALWGAILGTGIYYLFSRLLLRKINPS